jgi:PAS domain S-box-containing protein
MNLNRKIVLVLIAGISLYTAVGFAFHQYLILPSFHQLEEEEARKDMRRCLAALDSHITQIELLCTDWSAWDDTSAFVEAPTEGYAEANLYPSWFADNDMNIMFFFRSDATLVWGKYYDFEAGAFAPFPDFAEKAWTPEHPLLNHRNRDSVVRGVLRTSLGPMLTVSRPILPSEQADGEVVRGALIMGRLLDKEIVQSIRDQTQVAVDVIDLARQTIPSEAEGLAEHEIRVVEESPEMLRVLTHSHDFRGRDTLVLDATVPRRIMARGHAAIRLNMLAAGIAGFVFLLMLLSAMKWLVSDPLQRLSAHVKGVGLGRDMNPAPLASRQDEIGEVATEFNRMLERLQAEETELLSAQGALRASQARTRTILETAPDAIVIIDMAGRVESANQAAAELFARSGADFPGSPAIEMIAPESRDLWGNVLLRARDAARSAQGSVESELRALGRGGVEVPIHVNVTTTDLDGTPYYTCSMRDVSALKMMQEKVARNQHLARIGEMGATVAHEIRNPLAGMKGALQIMAGGTLGDDEHAQVLKEVQGLIERISGTVEQLLRYAKPIEPKLETVVLRNMVESVCDGPHVRAPEGIEVTMDCSESLLVEVDSRLFRQVLENIWANACQAVRPEGRIHWRAFQADGTVEIQLYNDGKSIRASDLPHIFEPFFTTRVEGSGLGLAVSQRIVEAHDGTVYIENSGDTGVNVVICIPQGE